MSLPFLSSTVQVRYEHSKQIRVVQFEVQLRITELCRCQCNTVILTHFSYKDNKMQIKKCGRKRERGRMLVEFSEMFVRVLDFLNSGHILPIYKRSVNVKFHM